MLVPRPGLALPLSANSPLARRLAAVPFLVVDDSPFVRRTVKEILHSLAVRIVSDAADGFEALEEARRVQPKVIILDWFMPGFSGSDFMRVLRYSRRSPAPHADVLVITGRPTLSLVSEAQRYGVAAIIRKPFAPRALLERLTSPALRLNAEAEADEALRPLDRLPRPGPAPRTLPRASPHMFGDDVGRPAALDDDPLTAFSPNENTWAI
jgi:DNA-binding NarL/FixJ family response regulator